MNRLKARSVVRAVALLPFVSCLGVASGAVVSAQETIASDRPGIGSGAFVLGSGTVQVETGFELSSTPLERGYSMGQLLVRAGIPGVHLEFDVLGGSYRVGRGRSLEPTDQSGFTGVGLGLKIPLWPNDGGVFALSVQGVLWAPTDASGSPELAPALYILSDVAIGPLGLGLNLGVAGSTDAGEEVISASVTPALSVGGGFGVYAGWAATFEYLVDDCEQGYPCRRADTHIGEAGVTFLASSDVQLDLNGGWDLGGDAWFIGTGMALRWSAW